MTKKSSKESSGSTWFSTKLRPLRISTPWDGRLSYLSIHVTSCFSQVRLSRTPWLSCGLCCTSSCPSYSTHTINSKNGSRKISKLRVKINRSWISTNFRDSMPSWSHSCFVEWKRTLSSKSERRESSKSCVIWPNDSRNSTITSNRNYLLRTSSACSSPSKR